MLNFAVEEPEADAWHGHSWSEEEQIARLDEFLTVFKGVWNEAPFTYEGRYYEVLNGGFGVPLSGQPSPEIQFSGESDLALQLSAKHADVHILSAASPQETGRLISQAEELAAAHGRTLRFGLDAELVGRHDRAEAEEAGRERWRGHPPDPALVGAFPDVAERLAEYHAEGVDTFLLGSRPHFEEAYRVAQNILPRLPGRGEAGRKIA